ncbi:MAG TPA: TIGR01212 family radical SAM protein [bacterium]|nr:TIGR01212 family radical SAM protein [bacterium]
MDRYYRFSRYLRERFGCRVHKITVDAGFSCPNTDGTLSRQGCIFCNNSAFSPVGKLKEMSLEEQIEKGILYGERRYNAKKFIVYFQPNSNTYGSPEKMKESYDSVKKFGRRIAGIAIGTRPDCIDREKIELIETYAQDYEVWLEYGLQSVHDRTLKLINRNHTYGDFLKAVELTREKKGIKICAHVIIGLPGENEQDIIETAKECRRLKLDGIKIHPLHVVKNTAMEKMFREGRYSPWEFNRYVETLALLITQLCPETVIQRLTADCSERLLVAPGWLNDKERLLRAVEEKMEKDNLTQGGTPFLPAASF